MKMGRKKRAWMIGIIFLILAVPAICSAIGSENDPKDGLPAPGGTDVFLFYYRTINADTYKTNGKTSANIDLNTHVGMARYVHYFAPTEKVTIAGNLIVPFGYQQMRLPSSGSRINDSSSGLGDIVMSSTGYYNVYKSPSLSYWVTLGGYAIAPTGEYDHNKSVNLGANCWDFRVTLSPVVLRWKNVTFETTLSGDWYTNNNNYGAAGSTLQRDAVWTVQSHLSYDLTKTFWIAGSWYYHNGGETKINDVSQLNSINEHKVMGTVGINVAKNMQILLQYAADVSLDNGAPVREFHTRFAYMF